MILPTTLTLLYNVFYCTVVPLLQATNEGGFHWYKISWGYLFLALGNIRLICLLLFLSFLAIVQRILMINLNIWQQTNFGFFSCWEQKTCFNPSRFYFQSKNFLIWKGACNCGSRGSGSGGCEFSSHLELSEKYLLTLFDLIINLTKLLIEWSSIFLW